MNRERRAFVEAYFREHWHGYIDVSLSTDSDATQAETLFDLIDEATAAYEVASESGALNRPAEP